MATKEQYEFFKSLYDDEDSRRVSLIERGKVYVSLITLYSAFLTLTIKNDAALSMLEWALLGAAILFMLLGFAFAILALGVHEHQIPNSPKSIIHKFGDDPPTNEEFFDDRIVDFAVAQDWNKRVNDKRAKLIYISSVCVLIALCTQGIYLLYLRFPTTSYLDLWW